MCCVIVYCFVVCDVDVMLGCCGCVYVDFSGGLCSLCWIVVAVVNVGPCTCIYQVLLLSWRAQATLHQLSCDLGRGYVPWKACGGSAHAYVGLFICVAYLYHMYIVWISLCGPIYLVWCQVSLSVHTHSVHDDVSLPIRGLHLPVCTWCILPDVDLSVHGMRLPVFTCCGSFCIWCVLSCTWNVFSDFVIHRGVPSIC